jgi:tetratricopeptide (TPR) repeat protein
MKRMKAPDARWISHRQSLLALFLVAATVIAYLSVWRAGFIWDDDLHLTKNPCIVGPIGFKGIWTSAAAMYYPLVSTSFWLQHALWGLNPLPYHLVNIAMHAACAILLWQVLLRLRVKGAWLGAAIWALHPVQVESVAWVTELKNTQSCLFYLLSILFFLKWREDEAASQDRHRERWNYVVALICAVAAILSKSSTVMLPVVLGLCWWWIDGRWRWRNIPALVPFAFISLSAAVWTIWEQKFHAGALGATWTQSWPERLIIAGRAIWFYLGKLVWPHPLIFIYPRWQIDASQALAYLPALAAAGGLIILWWKRNGPLRPIFFAAAYFVISLFPVLDFFDVYFFRYSFVGDHLQYLASMGPLVLLGAGIASAFAFLHGKKRVFFERIGTVAALLVLGTLTSSQSAMYKDAETLWRTTLSAEPHSWMARNNLGTELLDQGRLNEALSYFEQALEENPNKAEIYNNIGNTLLQLGRVDESFSPLQKALELDPNRPDVRSNLGNALLRTGRLEESIIQLRAALNIKPDYVFALNHLGAALLLAGRADEAVGYLTKAIATDPNYLSARFNLANTLLQLRRVDEAVSELQKALVISPNNPEAQKNLAWVLATSSDDRIRDGRKAVALARRANELTGGQNPIIGVTLAAAYAEAGRFPEAVIAAEAARQVANDSGNLRLAQAINDYVQLYRSGQPFRDVR